KKNTDHQHCQDFNFLFWGIKMFYFTRNSSIHHLWRYLL
ncbi:uncharacterized protein METZ01_LOCUS197942, partial [marine metagenome]